MYWLPLLFLSRDKVIVAALQSERVADSVGKADFNSQKVLHREKKATYS